MKLSTRARLFLTGAAALLLAAVVSIYQLEQKEALINAGWGDIVREINRPYFHIGGVAFSPAFIVQSILVLVLLSLFSRKSSRLLRIHVIDRTNLGIGQRYALERTSTYVIFSVGLFIALQMAGVNLNSLTVLGGALGIGIGFGLQSIASNFVSGLILLFERPIKVGDRVEVGNLNGEVINIGARATWVRTNDNIVIVLPNTEFITKEVINWTANDRQVRFSVPLGVAYSSNPDEVRAILLDVAHRNTDVMDNPGPDVIFKGFGDSSLDFDLRVWTRTKVNLPQILRSDLYFEIFRAFREKGVEIPFPQRDLHIRSAEVPIEIRDAGAAPGVVE